MLRALAFLLLSVSQALAWQAGGGDVCEIVHEGDAGSVRVSYDLDTLDYAIAITLPRPWREGPVFAMRFEGAASLVITTDRHVLSEAGRTLTVTDRGFGNVLNGLEFNETATALVGAEAVAFALAGAAPAVRAFRACTQSLRV